MLSNATTIVPTLELGEGDIVGDAPWDGDHDCDWDGLSD